MSLHHRDHTIGQEQNGGCDVKHILSVSIGKHQLEAVAVFAAFDRGRPATVIKFVLLTKA
jgi:hypothetical protein